MLNLLSKYETPYHKEVSATNTPNIMNTAKNVPAQMKHIVVMRTAARV
jgi:hypothetical protein